MDCKDLRDRLAPLLDGELTADEERQVAQHLESCAACLDLVDRLSVVPLPPVASGAPHAPEFWNSMDRVLEEEAGRPLPTMARTKAWVQGEVRLSRGMALGYLLLLLAAFTWHLLRPEPPAGTAPPALAAEESPEPAQPAPRSNKVERASYTPTQQMY